MGGADEPCSSSMVKRGDGKRRRRQTKHYNRRKCYLKLPSASVRPRPNVKPNGDDQYVVERILAVFAKGERRAYYLDWHGSPKKESWVLSEDCDCAEYVAHFTAVTTAEGVLDCLLGQSVPQHIFELLQNNVKFTHVREMLGTSVAPTTEVNLSFAPDIEERQKAKHRVTQPTVRLVLEVEARQESDLRIGCVFSRFQNDKSKYRELDRKIISFGPCQTPTLAFVWNDMTKAYTSNRSRTGCYRLRLNCLAAAVKKFTEATVSDVSSQEHQKMKSDALNTFELPRVCSSLLNLSPITTMKLAQSVYTRGCISYPRTETTAYPNSFDFAAYYTTEGWHAALQLLDQTVKFDLGGEQFQFQCRVVTDPGFTTVLNCLMEQCGIGTEGSILTHFPQFCVRKYVTVEQNRQLVLTNLGIALIHGYRRVDLDQTLLSMRVNVERQMDLIANGKADYATIKQ
ncbi:hypothetical protein GPALN_003104 [Globodera pallida]|nr:hypothetical protein GPALN_003104 [Globodera pallida]